MKFMDDDVCLLINQQNAASYRTQKMKHLLGNELLLNVKVQHVLNGITVKPLILAFESV